MLDLFSLWQLAGVGVISLLAGMLGGMLGVGGSVIIIPGLVMLLGRPTGVEQHLYQAAAMTANVFICIPAAMRHGKAGTLMPRVLRWMIPAALVFVVLGVMVSNLPLFSGPEGSLWLGRLLGGFLLYVALVNAWRLIHPRTEAQPVPQAPPGRDGVTAPEPHPHVTPMTVVEPTGEIPLATDQDTPKLVPASLSVGSIMGLIAGLLGIGGGSIAVPLQQAIMKLPLRNCIANSSAVICVSATFGAIYKNATLAQHTPPVAAGADAAAVAPLTWASGVILGLLLAPFAAVGGRLGASLTHSLPLPAIRAVFVALMIVAAWKVAGF